MANTRKKTAPKNNKRMGPPNGNRNAMRHGLKSGQMPKDCRHIEHRLNRLRRSLEDAVVAAKGEVSLQDAGNIQTAVRWEKHSCLCHRWLTKKSDTLKPLEMLQFSKGIAEGSTKRDKAVAALNLDRDVLHDAWAEIDATGPNALLIDNRPK